MGEPAHTSEPWSIERSNEKTGFRGIGIKNAEGHYLANMVFQLRENELAIARRIVACVNACAGIPTADLERARATLPKAEG